MQFTRPVSPPKPVSPRKSKSGFFARLFDNSTSRKKRDNRIAPAPLAPDYSYPAPAPAPIDRDDPMLNFDASKPTSKISFFGFRSSRVDPRHAGIRRSRKMRKSKRRKGRKGRTRTRTRRRRH